MNDDVSPTQPCPCGSGRKYLRCCMRKPGGVDKKPTKKRRKRRRKKPEKPDLEPEDEQPDPAPTVRDTTESPAADAPAAPALPSGYAMCRIAQKAPDDPRIPLDPETRRGLEELPYTIDELAEWETEELVEALDDLGLNVDRESFREQAAGRQSAWDLGDEWCERLEYNGQPKPDRWEDLVCLGACELWKRWVPEHPSAEMLDDWIHEGYQAKKSGDRTEAVEWWMRVWDTLTDRMTEDVTTRREAEKYVSGYQSVFNWVQDARLLFLNVSLDSDDAAETGVDFLREVLDEFPDEKPRFRRGVEADLAEVSISAGRREEGLAIHERHVDEHPDDAGRYARYASALNRGPDADPEAALDVLNDALDRDLEGAADFDLRARRDHLRNQLDTD
ncbi:MAG: SEC-C metal-binding domain-containing protein [Bradymonadaceae bacterium]